MGGEGENVHLQDLCHLLSMTRGFCSGDQLPHFWFLRALWWCWSQGLRLLLHGGSWGPGLVPRAVAVGRGQAEDRMQH